MAIFHLQVKNISRGKGKSATASAAYRAAERIEDLRTGLVYDYRKKKGVAHSFILAPEKAPSWMKDRAELWNRVEETEIEQQTVYTDSRIPQHRVTISPFYMGKYPITQAQWRVIASLPKVYRELELNPSCFKGDNLPVEGVNHFDAEEFCCRLSRHTRRRYKLPSEAEWEYACRAGTTTPFYFGETITSDLVNYNGNYVSPSELYREKTTPVGQFLPNAFGLYDMHGNVWEWCADCWHDDYKDAPIDGGSTWIVKGLYYEAVLRGGSWSDNRYLCRSDYRNHEITGCCSNHTFGFRVAAVLPWTS